MSGRVDAPVYVERARDQMEQVVATFEDAFRIAPETDTWPDLQELRTRAEEFKALLEDSLAKQGCSTG